MLIKTSGRALSANFISLNTDHKKRGKIQYTRISLTEVVHTADRGESNGRSQGLTSVNSEMPERDQSDQNRRTVPVRGR